MFLRYVCVILHSCGLLSFIINASPSVVVFIGNLMEMLAILLILYSSFALEKIDTQEGEVLKEWQNGVLARILAERIQNSTKSMWSAIALLKIISRVILSKSEQDPSSMGTIQMCMHLRYMDGGATKYNKKQESMVLPDKVTVVCTGVEGILSEPAFGCVQVRILRDTKCGT